MSDLPHREKILELAVTLMAGQGFSAQRAVTEVIEAWEKSCKAFEDATKLPEPKSPVLPGPAQDIWRETTGQKKYSGDWKDFPKKVKDWSLKLGLRAQLAQEVELHLQTICTSNDNDGPLQFPNDSILRFVVDLLFANHDRKQLDLGSHVHFFHLADHLGDSVTGLVYQGHDLEFEKPVDLTRKFSDLARELHFRIHRFNHDQLDPEGDVYRQPLDESGSNLRATENGINVLHSKGTCQIQQLILSSGNRIEAGFLH